MADLTIYNEENKAFATLLAQKAGASFDLALAYVKSLTHEKKCKAMDAQQRTKMCDWIRETYFPHNQMTDPMRVGIATVICEGYGSFSKNEVVEALKLAAGGRLANVSLDVPLTPSVIGNVLKAYTEQKRHELIAAYVKLENEKQQRQSQRGFIYLTEADMEACREGIRKVAREWGKKENLKHWYYMDYIQPHLDAGAIKDLSEERKEALQRNAESDARIDQYRYNQARGRQGFVSINQAIELSEDEKVNAFKALYAHELIALNLIYFATQF
jgi:hypothetical protein